MFLTLKLSILIDLHSIFFSNLVIAAVCSANPCLIEILGAAISIQGFSIFNLIDLKKWFV